MACNSPAHEIYFGGAAGAGKTNLGIGLAITQHRRSLILRRNAVNTVEIVDQLKRFARGGSWRSLGYGGMMQTADGRMIEVGGCDHEDDKEKYQGRPHDLIVLDESPHFTRTQFLFICAWNRHENPQQRCRILLPGNPPTTPEGRWIIKEFAPWLDPDYEGEAARPGELRWYTVLKGELTWLENGEPFMHEGERITPRSRTFIPGRLSDNPILAATDYGARLQALPEPLRSQLLYGDMLAGGEDDPWQVIPTEWVRLAMARWVPEPPKDLPMSALGVDPARGGKDKTVLSARYGPWFAALQKFPGSATPDGPAVATLAIRAHKDEAITNVDVIGIGSSVYDCLKPHSFMRAVAVNNAGATALRDRSGKLKFTNIRAASYWKLREALDPAGEVKLMLPPDNELLADLCAAKWKLLASGIQIEPKEDIIERIGRSPDCFVAGTSVMTDIGSVLVENMRVGMRVWTRFGLRSVVKAGRTHRCFPTKIVVFSNGAVLRGTPDHPVFVQGKGFVAIDALVLNDKILTCENNPAISSFFEELSSFDFRKGSRFPPADTSIRSQMEEGSKGWEDCTKKFGGQNVVQSLRAGTFTTRTRIPSIIPSSISNVSVINSTCSGMATRALRKLLVSNAPRNLRQNGMGARKDWNGIQNMGGRHGSAGEQKSESVLSAERITSTKDCEVTTAFVLDDATCDGITATRRISPKNYALVAEGNSFADRPERIKHAPSLAGPRCDTVVSICDAEPAEVFNLTVEGNPEYYANGILVHNCADAVVLSHWSGLKQLQAPRFIRMGQGQQKGLRIVYCDKEQLKSLAFEMWAALVVFEDHPHAQMQEVQETVSPPRSAGISRGVAAGMGVETSVVPRVRKESGGQGNSLIGHSLLKLVESPLRITVNDVNPAHHQATWGQPVEPFGRRAEELMFSTANGKALWQHLLRDGKRKEKMLMLILAGEPDNKVAKSVAYALSDQYNLTVRGERINVWSPDDGEDGSKHADNDVNSHVVAMVKQCRSMVMG